MMLAPALALVAMVAAASPLDDARVAFADGRYADAEAQALAGPTSATAAMR